MEFNLKRLLSFAVALFMVLTMVPFDGLQVFAADGDETVVTEDATVTPGQASLPEGVADQITAAAAIQTAAKTALTDGTCPACDGKAVTWTALGGAATGNRPAAGTHTHYYIQGEFSNTAANAILGNDLKAGDSICLLLVDAQATLKGRFLFYSAAGGVTFNVMGTGTVHTTNTASGNGLISNTGANTVNLYGGTFTSDGGALAKAVIYHTSAGGVTNIWTDDVVIGDASVPTTMKVNAYVSNGTLNMYAGTIRNGYTTSQNQGGNVFIYGSATATFNMYGGTVSGGSGANGAIGTNVHCRGKFNMYGGEIKDGKAASYQAGGQVSVSTGVAVDAAPSVIPTFNMYGGKITGGVNTNSVGQGGNINIAGSHANADAKVGYGKMLVTGTALIEGGKMNGAGFGGNIEVARGGELEMTGGTIACGLASGNNAEYGGAIALSTGATANISGGTISGCKAATNGGNIYAASGSTLNITGGTFENGYTAGGTGANLWIGTDTEIKGATISGGNSAASHAGNIFVASAKVTVASTTTVSGGKAAQNGGNIYVNDAGELIVNGTVTGGLETGVANATSGGNIYVGGGTATINGKVNGGHARNGGNLCVADGGTLTLSDTTISGGTASSASLGNNIRVYDATLKLMNGATCTSGILIDHANGAKLDVDSTFSGNVYVWQTCDSYNYGDAVLNATCNGAFTGRFRNGNCLKTAKEGTDPVTYSYTTLEMKYDGGTGLIFPRATVSNIGYATLAEAIAVATAAEATSNEVKLYANIELDAEQEISAPVVLTMNSKTLTGTLKLTDVAATVTGPETLTVTTDLECSAVAYADGTHKVVDAHTEGEAVIENNTAAGCESEGSYDTVTYCTVCGEELSRVTTTVNATGHTAGEIVVENEVAADCVNDGSYDNVVYCTVCKAELSRDTVTVKALGHTESEPVVENNTAAGCESEGSYDTVTYCTVCGEELSRVTTTVNATGHTAGEIVVENEVAPNCVDAGSYDNVIYCTVCTAQISRETIAVDALGHTEGEAVIENNVDPDCDNEGSYDTVVYCTVCTAQISRVTTTVDALGHSYEAVVTPPNCVDDGYTTHTCSVCGDTYTDSPVDALGHDYQTTVVEPTEDVAGYTLHECTRCGASYTSDTKPALGKGYMISFVVPYGVDAVETQKIHANLGAELPTPVGTPAAAADYTFVGWSAEKVSESNPVPTLLNGIYYPTKDAKLYAVYSCTLSGDDFNLVTDASALTAGTEVIIVNGLTDTVKSYYAMSTNQKSNNRGAVAVDVNGTTIAVTNDDVQVLVLEEGTVDGTFAFKVDNQYLYAASSSGNQLKTGTKSANASWLIEIDDNGTASIVAQGTNTRNVMQFNPNNGSPLFACYEKASQTALQLYAKGGAASETVYYTAPEYTVTYSVPEGVAEITNETVVAGNSVTLPTPVGTPDGEHTYTFAGWATEAVGNSAVKPNLMTGEFVPNEAATTLYAVYSYETSGGAGVEVWKLVTDASSLTEGDEIVIANTENKKALSTTQNGNNRGQATIEVNSDGTITLGDGVQIITLTEGTVNGSFGFNVGNGYLYAASSSKNYLRTQTNNNANGSWMITINDVGTATVKAQGTNTRNLLQYNKSSSIFSAYSGAQQIIQLYKKSLESGTATYYTTLTHTCVAGEPEQVDVVPATCTTPGSYVEVIKCAECGEEISRKTITVPVIPHTEGEVVVENEVAATCTTEGSYDNVIYCTVCDEELDRETVTVPVIPHTEGEVVVENEVAATCTTEGSYDNVVYCTVCNAELDRETITVPVIPHTEGEVVVENEVAATCTTEGSYDNVVYCTVCNAELKRDTITVPVIPHTPVEIPAADPTFDAPGNTAGVKCDVCGEILTAPTEIPALIAVAKVGDDRFETLADAIAAADGKTVTVLENIELTNSITIKTGKTITLDLNGKTISGVCNVSQGYLFNVANAAKLTIKDSSDPSTGKITYAGNSSTGWIVAAYGDLVLESGTLELTGTWNIGYAVDIRPNAWGTAYTAPSTFTMNGGKILSSDGAVRVASSSSDIYSNISASFIMNDGFIDAAWDGIFVQQSNAAWDVLSVAINGGTIESDLNPIRFYGPAATSYVNGEDCVDIALNGGTLTYTGTEAREWLVDGILRLGGGVNAEQFMKDSTVTASEAFAAANVAEDYKWVESDGTYVLTAKTYVAQVGEKKFETLQAAVDGAVAGETIVLIRDVEFSGVIDNDVTLDLNGHTLTGEVAATLKMNGGTLVTTNTPHTMAAPTGAKYNTTDAIFAIEPNGNITIVEGTVTLGESWWTGEGQTLTIAEDATFKIPAGLNLNVLSTVKVLGNVEIEGTITLYIESATIESATEIANVVTNVADHEVVYENGVYKVVAKHYVAKIGEQKFVSLQAAVDGAVAGDTIVLLEDIDLTERVNVTKSVTIDLNDKTVTADGFYAMYIYSKTEAIEVTVKNGSLVSDHAVLFVDNWYEAGTVLNVYDCNIKNTTQAEAIYLYDYATVNIYSGTFETANPNAGEYFVLNIRDNNRAHCDINVYGGTFVNFDPSNNAAEGENTNFCAEGYTALPDLNGNFVVGTTPDAEANNLGAITVPAGDYMVYGGGSNTEEMPLNFVMQYLAKQNAADMATSPFADWYGDFVLTFTGIEDGSFVADNCYLAGYYGDFGWVKVPVDGMVIENGAHYPVMLGVGMGQKYEYICSGVQDFRCALYLDPAIFEANPNLKVTLELNIVDNSKGEDAAAEALVNGQNVYEVTEHIFGIDSFMEPVAAIGEQKFYFLEDAVEAAQNGDTIVILKDIELTDGITVAADKTITLDLNGKTVSMVRDGELSAYDQLIDNYGNLTVTDTSAEANGELKYQYVGPTVSTDFAAVTIVNRDGATLTIAGGTVNNCTSTGHTAYAIDNISYSKVTTLNITGGTVTSVKGDNRGLAVRACVNGTQSGLNVVNISGGTITGGYAGFQVFNISSKDAPADINITGGTINAGSYAMYTTFMGADNSSVDISVSGGTFNAPYALFLYNSKTGSADADKVFNASVSGGTFNGEVWIYAMDAEGGYAYQPVISGGVFRDPVYEVFCAEGFIPTENGDGTYGVKVGKYVAQIGDNKFETLQAAIDAANAGDTITLIADVELTTFVTINKSITLDIGEYDITRADGTALYVNGDVEVTIQGTTGTVTGTQALYVNKGLVKIYSGNFCGAYDECVAVYLINTGKVEIYGGTFSVNGESDFVLNEYDSTRETSSITVYGGTFVGFNPEENAAEGAGTDFTADGYIGVEDGNGNYIVREGVWVAKVGNKKFESIVDAIAAANAGDIIVLLTDVAYTGAVDTAIVIDLNGKTLTGDISATLKMNGGYLVTSMYDMVGPDNSLYLTEDAVMTILPNLDMTVTSGTITLGENDWWTMPNQVVTIAEDAKFVIPTGMNLNVQGTVIVEGAAVVEGSATLYNTEATIEAAEGLNVITVVDGKKVVYKNGVYCLADENIIAWNETTGYEYETVESAVAAANSGETVQLLCDANATAFFVWSGITLDLNGYKLTANGIAASFVGANIIDSSAAGTGVLVVPEKAFSYHSDNAQVVLKTDAGFRFVDAKMKQALVAEGSDYKFWVGMDASTDMLIANLINQYGAANLHIQIRTIVSWETDRGYTSQKFCFKDQLVDEFIAACCADGGYTQALWMKVLNAADLTNLAFTAQLVIMDANGNDLQIISGETVYAS